MVRRGNDKRTLEFTETTVPSPYCTSRFRWLTRPASLLLPTQGIQQPSTIPATRLLLSQRSVSLHSPSHPFPPTSTNRGVFPPISSLLPLKRTHQHRRRHVRVILNIPARLLHAFCQPSLHALHVREAAHCLISFKKRRGVSFFSPFHLFSFLSLERRKEGGFFRCDPS